MQREGKSQKQVQDKSQHDKGNTEEITTKGMTRQETTRQRQRQRQRTK